MAKRNRFSLVLRFDLFNRARQIRIENAPDVVNVVRPPPPSVEYKRIPKNTTEPSNISKESLFYLTSQEPQSSIESHENYENMKTIAMKKKIIEGHLVC